MHHLIPTLLFLFAACDTPETQPREQGPMDGIPAGTTTSPDGRWRASVEDGGRLVLHGPDGATELALEALPEVAFSSDGTRLVYAARTDGPGTDLYLLDLPPNGAGRRLLDWESPEDRPALSPDGRRLAFTSGRTGIASVWVLDLDSSEATQLTNVGLENLPRASGQAPAGFVPPPKRAPAWVGDHLHWTAQGQRYAVEVAK